MIGDLRERVTIQDQTQALGDIGDSVTTWTDISTVWAEMTPVSERTLVVAARDEAQFDWLCTIRFRTDMSTKMRIVWKGRFFDIRGFRNADERRRFLTIRLVENGG